MPERHVETFQHNGRWHNRIEGRGEVLFSHDTLEDAVAEARKLARNLQATHMIREMDESHASDTDSAQLAG